jgi:hypothetical protein
MSLALRLTLLLLLLHPVGAGWLRASILALAAAGLVLPGAHRRPALWLALALLGAWRVGAGWPLADNHAYLLVYWCLAIGLALLGPEPQRALAWNGRALVGLAFACAVFWKVLSPDYLDARFFRVALVEDRRLEPLATALGGVERETLRARRAFLERHVDGPGFASAAPAEPAALRRLALAATWLTLALEAAVALAFLAPLGGRVWLRHALLLVFCATTYAVAPVVSFGWLLLALGVSQCAPEARRARLAYLGVFALLVFYAHASPAGGAVSSRWSAW